MEVCYDDEEISNCLWEDEEQSSGEGGGNVQTFLGGRIGERAIGLQTIMYQSGVECYQESIVYSLTYYEDCMGGEGSEKKQEVCCFQCQGHWQVGTQT